MPPALPRLTLDGVRSLHLAAQGLLTPPARPATSRDVMAAIRRMGSLQIDSISVVARSHYLVLWSRLGQYDPAWLDRAVGQGKLFEYWAHAVSFIPMEYWPLYRRDMIEGHPRWRRWLDEHPDVVERVRERLRHGPVRSSEWEREGGRSSGWWDWKPEKIALEGLFYTGEVMIGGREGFQRVYDLRERVYPEWDDAALPAAEDAASDLALLTVRALGVARPAWVPPYLKRPRAAAARVQRLADEGRLLRVEVDGWDEPGYVHPENAALARRAARGLLRPERTVLLSPFDPVIADRERLQELWDFEYRIEVYTPAKRRYGYFTLPILHRGRIVGRLDPKAHRAQGLLEIRNVHLEDGVAVTDGLVHDLAATLRDFATWQNLTRVEIGRSTPDELAPLLQVALAANIS